jgi:Gas vesicle synthesis protein GvpL/GvpF
VTTRAGAERMHDAAAPTPAAQEAIWLYAITHSRDQAGLDGLPGVGGGQIRTLQSGPLTAVVESLDPGKFSAEGLQGRLSDPAELGVIARRHHDVVVAVAAEGPTLPFRLATVYVTDDRVHSLLSLRKDEFCHKLDWLAGRTECGIKAWADPDFLFTERGTTEPAARGPGGRPAGGEPPGPAEQSGSAYLFRRRAELAARVERQRLAARCGQEIHTALERLAAAAHLHPTQDPRSDGEEGLMVLNAAYLVESALLSEFADAAQAVGAEAGALKVDVTGPWPAYSFADGPDA